MRLSFSGLGATSRAVLSRIPYTDAHFGGNMPRSAGDHTFREIHVRVYPYGERATVSVHTRKRRGTAVVWERHLGTVGIDLPPDTDTSGVAGVLRLAAAQLLRVADADRH
jgi:hypothetical protein